MDLGLVDVEWADGEGGWLRKVLEAVSRVRFEPVLPVRRFTSYQGQRHFSDWYWAATTQSLVGVESWLERDRTMLLDHDRRVVGLASQPFRVTWQGEKRRIWHTPNYFARLDDGSGLVVDVRPADRVGPEDAVKFSATEGMCQEMGCWSFALVHEPDPVEMANVRWLSGYRHPRNRVGDVAKRLMDTFDDPRLRMDGIEEVGDPLSVLPTLYHLLWCGDLRLDLSVPLEDGSMIGRAAVSHG
ncbi:TnsA-like heteromeric transposase endonuclease subunit [Streptomyces sp. NBC_01013]|uniref:TnsA-like heteromeric transposase endonuclease subunit n=1 Tax=Streptomyces sp. NBC_01013 TaxID=2903718 RepID=UPI00386755C9|nr:TnsA-like heteromeric transposase endonuclease subunit [Streptomyces sp. NBC_01013]